MNQPAKQVPPLRISISQAAKLFGISDRTIRRALTRGEIRYIVVRNRYQLHFESILNWSHARPQIIKKRDQQGIGQWVEKWKISNPKFSPNPPSDRPSSPSSP